MTCEINPDMSCEFCEIPYCPDKFEDIQREHYELTQAVQDAIMELERFKDEYGEVL